MLKRFRSAAFGLGVLLITSAIATAAGIYAMYPFIGGASFCASTVSGAGGFAFPDGNVGGGGNTGQGQASSGSLCAQTVPAGPLVFAGTEYFAVDVGAIPAVAAPTTANVALVQVGQGPMVDVTTVLTAQTIPNNTPFYFLDGAQASALTVTMPAAPVEGQIQRVVCEAATVGVLTIAANSGQTLKDSPGVACVAGVGYAYRYQASNTTWYRF
jgi:hypothetical protein